MLSIGVCTGSSSARSFVRIESCLSVDDRTGVPARMVRTCLPGTSSARGVRRPAVIA